MGTTCTNPEKITYRSERAAKAAVRDVQNHGRDGGTFLILRPYRCGMHWHIGHAEKARPTTPGKRFR